MDDKVKIIRSTDEFMNGMSSRINSIVDELAAFVQSTLIDSFLEQGTFDKNGNGLLLDALNFPGVYFIEIKNPHGPKSFKEWLEKFEGGWKKYKGNFTPSVIKKRVWAQSQVESHDEWIPMYIGISKRISGRVWEHINLGMGQRTFALKLKERENLRDELFRLKTIKVEVEDRTYDWLLPTIERSLRDKINPIIGKQ